MSFVWSFFGILQAISILLMAVTLYRLFSYIKKYQFDESNYTLLFSFIHLRWIAWLYGFLTIFWIFTSIFILSP